jgi:hypothetical protein
VDADVAASWDAEYAAGCYARDVPVGFVRDVLAAARQHGLRRGLYVGCGNGRNLVPLVDAGLDLTGLDIEVLTARVHRTERTPPSRGHWSQWEVIWRRHPAAGQPVT